MERADRDRLFRPLTRREADRVLGRIVRRAYLNKCDATKRVSVKEGKETYTYYAWDAPLAFRKVELSWDESAQAVLLVVQGEKHRTVTDFPFLAPRPWECRGQEQSSRSDLLKSDLPNRFLRAEPDGVLRYAPGTPGYEALGWEGGLVREVAGCLCSVLGLKTPCYDEYPPGVSRYDGLMSEALSLLKGGASFCEKALRGERVSPAHWEDSLGQNPLSGLPRPAIARLSGLTVQGGGNYRTSVVSVGGKKVATAKRVWLQGADYPLTRITLFGANGGKFLVSDPRELVQAVLYGACGDEGLRFLPAFSPRFAFVDAIESMGLSLREPETPYGYWTVVASTTGDPRQGRPVCGVYFYRYSYDPDYFTVRVSSLSPDDMPEGQSPTVLPDFLRGAEPYHTVEAHRALSMIALYAFFAGGAVRVPQAPVHGRRVRWNEEATH